MLQKERHNEIMNQLYKYRTVKVSELSQLLGVTRETIRKDLYDIEEEGLVKKVHGGATLKRSSYETKYSNRKSINEVEKRSIAKKAAEFVDDYDTIYIDYGTTALLFAREIIHKENLTIVTNSLPIANELIDYSDFEVIIIGGNVRRNERSLYGPIAYRGIDKIYVDKGFFSTGNVDLKAGYTNLHMGESEVSRMMLENSQKTIMMADYSKFNAVAMNRIASINEVDVLITDSNADSEFLEELEERRIKHLVVDIEEGRTL